MLKVTYLYALILFSIQFTNLAVPGRYTHILCLVIFTLFVMYHSNVLDMRIGKKIASIITLFAYGAILTVVGFLCSTISFGNTFSVSTILIVLYYFFSYLILFVSLTFIFRNLNVNVFLSLVLSCHSITLLIGLLTVSSILPYSGFYNVVESKEFFGRLPLLDKEPSVSSFRIAILFYFCVISIFVSRSKLGSYSSFFMCCVFAYLLFEVKSKSSIFLIPLSFVLSSLFLVLASNKSTLKRLGSFFKIGLVLLPCLFLVINSNYFNYAFSMTFANYESGSSALSRLVLGVAGLEMILSYPLGFGKSYPLYYKEYIESALAIFWGSNSELDYMLGLPNAFNSIYSPKNIIIQIGLVFGVFGLMFTVFVFVNAIRNILSSQRSFSQKNCLLSLVFFLFGYLFVSDPTPTFIIYSTLASLLVSKFCCEKSCNFKRLGL